MTYAGRLGFSALNLAQLSLLSRILLMVILVAAALSKVSGSII